MKRHVSLGFRRTELIMDIRNAAYLLAKSSTDKSENPDKEDNWMIDVFQSDGDITGMNELPTRWMNLASKEIDFKLRRWSGWETNCDYAGDDTFTMPDVYTYHLHVEDEPKVTFSMLKELIHNWIVYKVLCQWSMLVAPEYYERIAATEKDLASKVEDAVSDQGKPFLRPHYPFER